MTCPRCNDTGAVHEHFCSCVRGARLWAHIQADPVLRRHMEMVEYLGQVSGRPAEAPLEQLRFEIDDHIN